MGGGITTLAVGGATAIPKHVTPSLETVEIKEGPRPGRSTVIGFYALVVVTTALGIWALMSLF
jgi:hypothetical protein